MKIDPNMLKEINKSVDGFVKKNKMALDNAREVDKLKKTLTLAATKIVKMESKVANLELNIKLLETKIKANEQYIKIKSHAELDKMIQPIFDKWSKANK